MNRDIDILTTMRLQGMPAVDIEYVRRAFLERNASPAATPAPVAQKVTNAPPAEFVEYMAKNYPPNTVIVDAAWHARPIWNAACHALQNCGLLAARNQPEKK